MFSAILTASLLSPLLAKERGRREAAEVRCVGSIIEVLPSF
jgi:hypothetical protein